MKLHSIILLLALTVAVQAEKPRWRYPAVSCPQLAEAPVVDGKVRNAEWLAAAQYTTLLRQTWRAGYALETRVVWYLGYTPEKLYLAFKIYRPEQAVTPNATTSGEGKNYLNEVYADDCVELLLDVGGRGVNAFDLALNARGDYSDYRIAPNDRYEWNLASLDYKARVTSFGWEGELALDFKTLGIAAPKGGERWGIDFVVNEKTPGDRVAGFSAVTNTESWMRPARFGVLNFLRAGAPVVRVEQFGPDSEGGGIDLTVSGSEARTEAELYRETSPVAFFRELDAGGGSDQTAKKLIDRYFSRMDRTTDDLKPAAGMPRRRFSLMRTLEPGRYLVRGQVTAPDGTVLFSRVMPFRVEPPVKVELRNFFLSDDSVEAEVDLANLPGRSSGKVRAELLIDGKSIGNGEREYRNVSMVRIPLSAKAVPPGRNFELRVTVTDGNKPPLTLSLPEKRPAAPAWRNFGRTVPNRVPAPWAPLAGKNGVLTTATGKISFRDDALLPRQMIAGNKALFAALPQLTARTADGRTISLDTGKRTALHGDGFAMQYEFNGEAVGGVRLNGTARYEFDGFGWYDFTLNTGSETPEWKELYLDFPLKREHAVFFNHSYQGTHPFRFSDHGNWDRLPEKGLKLKFVYGLWLGDCERGLSFAWESDRNWDNADSPGAVEIIRQGERTIVRFHLIGKTRRLGNGTAFSFGIQPTPVKPIQARTFTDVVCNYNAPHPWESAKTYDAWKRSVIGQIGKMGGNWGIFFNNIGSHFGHIVPPSPLVKKRLAEAAKLSRDAGVRTVIYSAWAFNAEVPELKPYMYDMVRLPLGDWRGTWGNGLYKQCPGGAWSDMFLAGVADLADSCGIDGVYTDQLTELSSCINLHHGCGYRTADGTVRPTFPVRKMRELHRRLYTLLESRRGENDFMIYSHNSSQPVFPPVDAFISRRCYAETFTHKPSTLGQVFNLDRICAGYNPAATGIASEITWWNGFHKTISNNNAMASVALVGGGVKGVVGHFLLPTFREGYAQNEHAELGLARALRALDRDHLQFIPFFRSKGLADSGSGKSRAALWIDRKNKQAVAVVSNLLNGGAISDAVTLRPGFPVRNVTDAVTKERIAVDSAGTVRLEIPQDSYRVLIVK